MSLRRLGKKLKKFVRAAAPIAATIGLGFVAGPAGAGFGARVLGGLGKIGKAGAKLAVPVIEAAARGQPQQATASPEFDQSDAALPSTQRFGPGFGRHRPRFSATLGSRAGFLPEEDASMSLLGTFGRAVLPGAGQIVTQALGTALGNRLSRVQPVKTASKMPTFGGGFSTGPGFPALSGTTAMGFPRSVGAAFGVPRRSKRINPTNVKALRRALRRVEGFVKLEKRVDKILRRAAPAARTARRSGFVKSRKR